MKTAFKPLLLIIISIIIISICFSFFTYSQMTPNEMIKIYSMDFDQFETYAIGKGYEFEEVHDEYSVYGPDYVKGTGKNTRYLSLYSRYYSDVGVAVTYQTSNSLEFLIFKSQMGGLGFKLIFTQELEGDVFKYYRNKKYELTLASRTGFYEITLNHRDHSFSQGF